jgi:hypothetical protein
MLPNGKDLLLSKVVLRFNSIEPSGSKTHVLIRNTVRRLPIYLPCMMGDSKGKLNGQVRELTMVGRFYSRTNFLRSTSLDSVRSRRWILL